jgi:hypothetical protein
MLTGRAQQNRISPDEVSEPTKPKGSLKSNSGQGTGRGASAAELIRATEKILNATEPLQPADASAPPVPTGPRKPLEAPQATERATPVAVMPATAKLGATQVDPNHGDTVKPVPTVERVDVTDQPTERAGPIAVFVSRKERKLLGHEGLVPLFTIPVVIEEPDKALGTHIFTAVGSTENGASIRWKLMAPPTVLSASVDHKDKPKGISESGVQAATEALNRIQWPNEAADRLIEFLIPGSSLVISDEGFGPITRSWCERIKPTGTMRA